MFCQVTRLLTADPALRLTASGALAHPFIHAKEEESLAALFPNNIYQEVSVPWIVVYFVTVSDE
jgi:hypothetical protein